MLLEHLCITARMGKRGKEEGGGINHYLLSEDTSGAPQCYHLAFEPIQLIKSTNYLFLLNPSFALINLPFLFVWGIFVSKYCKMENSTHSRFVFFQCYQLFSHYYFRAFLVGPMLKANLTTSSLTCSSFCSHNFATHCSLHAL